MRGVGEDEVKRGRQRMKEANTKRGMSGKGYRVTDAHGWHTKALTCTLPLYLRPACRLSARSHLSVDACARPR